MSSNLEKIEIDNPTTSAGFSFPGKKKKESHECAIQVAKYMLHRIKVGKKIF